MININNFGWRLGNQMFQLATAIAVAEKAETAVAFPEWKYAEIFEGDFTPVSFHSMLRIIHKEPGFHYTEISPKENMILDGYFQSEKYFKDCDKVKEMFKIKQDIIDSVYEKNKELLDRDNVVSVHLRRGDYLNFPEHHLVMNLNYFMKAMKKFPKDSIFLVFSDDTEWCKNNFPGIGEKFFIIEGQSDVEDFAMMTMCDHNCIANSSFSWWAAWLNDNPEKIVVAPEKWFGTAYADWNTDDLYCDDWIKI